MATVVAPEIWKVIDGFSKYECSSDGRIRNKKSARIFACKQVHDKYITVGLVGDDGKTYSKSVHRMVASLFVPIPNPKCTQVNHKDKDICHIAAVNLEWVTPSDNVRHAIATGTRKATRETKYIHDMREFVPVGIAGYEKYKVNEDGILISKNGRILNKGSDRSGYLRAGIRSSNGIKLNTSIHRLVAITFIPNPENKPMVNHKNGNRSDNRVENLEWSTQSENMIHAHNHGLISTTNCSRRIYRLELNGEIIDEWTSNDIVEKFSTKIHSIGATCRSYKESNVHNQPENVTTVSSKGYGWCYVDCFTIPIPNPSLLRTFPDIDIKDSSIDYDKLRPFVKNNGQFVWQLELDGTRMKMWQRSAIMINDIHVGTDSIGVALKDNSVTHGYGWSHVTAKDILYPESGYEKLITTTVHGYEIDFTRDVDFDLLRDSIKDGGGGKPIWEISLDGHRLKKWATRASAEQFYHLGRNTIEQVLKGKAYKTGDKMWEWASFYADDNASNYNIVSLESRFSAGKGKMIEQYDMKDNLIATFENMKDANSKIKFDICLSYPNQNGFTFKPVDKVFKKVNHNGIIQRKLSGEIVKVWNCSIRDIVKDKDVKYTRLAIGKFLNGQLTCKDFIWEYSD